MPSEHPKPVSSISQAYPDRVEVRGRDLCGDLMGRVSFTEYFHLLLTGDEATEEQRFFLDLLLVSIAEHGMMPSNVAARMTLAADPGSLHGAVAAGILGCRPGRPRHVGGVRAARWRSGAVARTAIRSTGCAACATRACASCPASGTPFTDPVDPRAERILELADERGVERRRTSLLARWSRDVVAEAWDKPLPMNVVAADRRGHARPRLLAPTR